MKKTLFCLSLVLCTFTTFAQKNYWHSVPENEALKINADKNFFTDAFQPAQYKLFTLSESDFAATLQQLQPAKNYSTTIIYLPVANGNVEKFSIKESTVMEPELQAKFSTIKTFVGQGIDDASKTVALSYTKLGLHASIMIADGKTMYINPVNNTQKLYAVFARTDEDKSAMKFKCETEFGVTAKALNQVAPSGNIDDGKLRTYRLALCTTGEWSLFFINGSEQTHYDSINTVLSALTVDLVRANQVYERDFGVHMNFVKNEDTLIFLNPSKDPFTVSNLNSACQQTCDSRIKNSGYDIGHVLHRGGDNGNAGCIGCVCTSGEKGSGFSTYSRPDLADYFVIDYWTHEMGHQYGANHTFTFSIELTNAQIEPGSGSTIMGYAGITGSTDVQKHSDDVFSTASIAQASAYIKTGGGSGCSAITKTGDHAPSANAGDDKIIPMLTPFVLTGSGSDVDDEDNLSYIWEQIDAYESGSKTFPSASAKTGPVFRSFNYKKSKQRTFPSDSTVLRGAVSSKWETLSSVNRDLNFRFTVRDNHTGGGNNKSDDVLIKVTTAAGPFTVTSPNAAVSWAAGSIKRIKWDVANTNTAPVKCTNVKIVISTDGGKTFKYVLKESTPNDGDEKVLIPNVVTSKARIAVEAVDNIFFDYSDKDFTITNSAVAAEPEEENVITANNSYSTVKPNPAKDFFTVTFNKPARNVSLVLSDVNGRTMLARNIQSIMKGKTETIQLRNFVSGTYFLKIITEDGTQTEKVIVN